MEQPEPTTPTEVVTPSTVTEAPKPDLRKLKHTIAIQERTIKDLQNEVDRLLKMVEERDEKMDKLRDDLTTAKALKTVVVSNTMAQLEVLLKQLNLEMRRD